MWYKPGLCGPVGIEGVVMEEGLVVVSWCWRMACLLMKWSARRNSTVDFRCSVTERRRYPMRHLLMVAAF